jgi:hypothetical protein
LHCEEPLREIPVAFSFLQNKKQINTSFICSMRKTAILILLLTISLSGRGQKLGETEKHLAELGQQTIFLKTEEERLTAGDEFAALLDATIGNEESFNYAFEAVQNLSKLRAPDKRFRIYTWSIPLKDGSYRFYGRLVLPDKAYRIIKLNEPEEGFAKPEFNLLMASEWYGAVYYDIQQTKHKKTTYYTLVGYRPSRATYNEKVLEVIDAENVERLRFGAQIFNTPRLNGVALKRPPYRLIFRYNPKTVFGLRWVEKEKRFVFDHLAPPDASMQTDWRTYGPDFTYDALYWEDGYWQLEEGIEMKGATRPTQKSQVQQGLPER